ncbi:trypsin-3-like [Myzus persicae]|uniref:trypsin-3-like n=1 Tax=Myzus persicae TaxID=13164 RepID=UPI000B9324DC|nr:trypsin-3-like [Myzus persicae]
MFEFRLCWFILFAQFRDMRLFKDFNDYPLVAAQPMRYLADGSQIPLLSLLQDRSANAVNNQRRHRGKHVYTDWSDWSDWSSCSDRCTTVRQRHCLRSKICGSNVVTESSYCFVTGSRCPGLVTNYYKRLNTSFSNKVLGNAYDVSVNSTCGVTVASATIPSFKTPRFLIKIMGGQESEKFHWPWQVAVLNGFQEIICGGTLVAPGWVLTAAHCSRRKLFVILKEYDLSVNEGDEIRARVERIIIHPRYNPNTIDNDMALLKLRVLDLEIYGGLNLQPACLPPSDFQRRKRKPKMCVVIGWGKVQSQDPYGSQILREARVPIVSRRTCRSAYWRYQITDNMFCAGYRDGRSDTCSGDSGGPLLCKMRGRWTVVGVTSFGYGCGRRGKYGIYANVANHVSWISSVTKMSGYQ